MLKWKVEDAGIESGSAPESDKGRVRIRVVSARKLAAGIWNANGGLGFEVRMLVPCLGNFGFWEVRSRKDWILTALGGQSLDSLL